MRAVALIAFVGCGPSPLVAPDGGGPGPCGRIEEPALQCRAEATATMRNVVDGDTIDVGLEDGMVQRVRLIGIDAPEHDEGDCGAPATAHLAMLAPAGSRLRLVFDVECRDAYGRQLSYVFAGRTSLGAAMVGDGYARACPFPPNTAHAGLLGCLEGDARVKKSGLWATDCLDDGCFQR